jgi:hypothetical protein
MLKKYGDGTLKIASTATPIILGTPNSMTAQNKDMRQQIEYAYEKGFNE